VRFGRGIRLTCYQRRPSLILCLPSWLLMVDNGGTVAAMERRTLRGVRTKWGVISRAEPIVARRTTAETLLTPRPSIQHRPLEGETNARSV
jgi:hypothetical protein